MPANPWMRTLTLTSHTVVYNLWTLMQALDVTLARSQCTKLQIQLDFASGGANLFIGSDSLKNSSTDYGVNLVAGQALNVEEHESNSINAEQFFLQSDTDAVKIHVFFHAK
jgi:hypothetical protein